MSSRNSLAESSDRKASLAPLDGSRVLLVEDEAIIAADIELALEEAGADVIGPARTLPQALTLAQTTPDISGAILDINLYGDSVFLLAEHLSSREIPMVFHTGFDLVAVMAKRFPDAKFLTKPVLLDDLLKSLADQLR